MPAAQQGMAPFMYVQGANGAVYMVPAAAMQQQMVAQQGMAAPVGVNHSFSVPNNLAQGGSNGSGMPTPKRAADPLDSLFS